MRKISLFMLILIVFGSSLIGCARDTLSKDKDNVNDGQKVFEADVIDTNERLLISPDKDSSEILSADRIVVSLAEAEILDKDGKAAEAGIFRPGDRVRITYNGLIAESYPAQITADKIEVIGHNDMIDGFMAIIDDLYQEDEGLNGDITMIAFDTSEWTDLSKDEIETILKLVESEYGFEVIQSSFDELKEQGLIDKDILSFKEGILIELKDIRINDARNKITCSTHKWRGGDGAIGWDAEAKFSKGEWKITRSNMWIS